MLGEPLAWLRGGGAIAGQSEADRPEFARRALRELHDAGYIYFFRVGPPASDVNAAGEDERMRLGAEEANELLAGEWPPEGFAHPDFWFGPTPAGESECRRWHVPTWVPTDRMSRLSGAAYLAFRHIEDGGVDVSVEPELVRCVFDVDPQGEIVGIEWQDAADAPEVVRIGVVALDKDAVLVWLTEHQDANRVGVEVLGQDHGFAGSVACHYDSHQRLIGFSVAPSRLLPDELRRRAPPWPPWPSQSARTYSGVNDSEQVVTTRIDLGRLPHARTSR